MWSPSTDDRVVPNPEAPGPLPRGLRHRGGPCAAPSSTCGSQASHPNPPDRTRGLSLWCTPATNGPMTAGWATWYGGRVRVRDHDDPGRGNRATTIELGAPTGRARSSWGRKRGGRDALRPVRPVRVSGTLWLAGPPGRVVRARRTLPARSCVSDLGGRRPPRREAGAGRSGLSVNCCWVAPDPIGGEWLAPASSPGRSRGALPGR
jgi:hypothetical protein